MKRLGLSRGLDGKRIVVQGLGNVGYHAAKFCREGGAILIAIAEREGAIMNPKGLNEDEVFNHRKATGSILNFPGATNLEHSAAALELECDVLLPAALESVLTKENAPRIKAKIILEGANGPTTPDADPIFRQKGMLVIPDIYCNAGGVTVSYFEWLKNLSHVRFGRMQKRHEQANELAMLKAIEEATGRKFTDADRERIAKGPDEQDLVNSGLEETMIAAFHELLNTKRTTKRHSRPAHRGVRVRDSQGRAQLYGAGHLPVGRCPSLGCLEGKPEVQLRRAGRIRDGAQDQERRRVATVAVRVAEVGAVGDVEHVNPRLQRRGCPPA